MKRPTQSEIEKIFSLLLSDITKDEWWLGRQLLISTGMRYGVFVKKFHAFTESLHKSSMVSRQLYGYWCPAAYTGHGDTDEKECNKWMEEVHKKHHSSTPVYQTWHLRGWDHNDLFRKEWEKRRDPWEKRDGDRFKVLSSKLEKVKTTHEKVTLYLQMVKLVECFGLEGMSRMDFQHDPETVEAMRKATTIVDVATGWRFLQDRMNLSKINVDIPVEGSKKDVIAVFRYFTYKLKNL